MPHLTASADESCNIRDGLDALAVAQMQLSSKDVTVSLTVHPDDTMAWVTVELIVEGGQIKMHSASSPALEKSTDEQISAAPASEWKADCGHPGASMPAGTDVGEGLGGLADAADVSRADEDGSESRAGQPAPALDGPSAPEATGPVRQTEGEAPPMNDWVAALPAVPKLPIRLATATSGKKVASPAAIEEPSYADLTAQLAGSSDASSSSAASDDDGSQSAVSEGEEDGPRDPRRELELNIAVADALAQVSESSGHTAEIAPRAGTVLDVWLDRHGARQCQRHCCLLQAEAEHEAERSSETGSDADDRHFGNVAARGQQGAGGSPDPQAEFETDLAVEALLAAAAEMGAGGPGSGGHHDTNLLQVVVAVVSVR